MRAYAHDVFGVGSWIGVTAGSTLDEVRTDPTEWGTGAAGYGRRFASRGGHLVVQETVRHGMAAALGRSTAYMRCGCRDFGGRVTNAFTETFTDTDSRGERMFSVPRITGAFAGSFATMLWRPHATAAGAARDGAVGLVFTVAGNVLKEYVHSPS